MRILLVEDEKRIASFIERGLKEKKFVVDIAGDGEQGLYLAEINPYDAIILDLVLPGEDGLEICKKLRKQNILTPILMLTARGEVRDRVMGLNAGADDYLAKPFSFEELIARLRALLRRQQPQKTNHLKVADLELNMLNHEVQRAGNPITLTSKEYMILECLMLHANQVVTRTMLSEHVWQENFQTFTNVIDVYIRYLRSKIDEGHPNKMIQTLRGSGYMLKG
ncbi:MAG: response regulator transcription factor [Candidatus Omnitrophica bacterium]|nr:response regulator transcription factor [Candidatus Omnitrophota bacterium]